MMRRLGAITLAAALVGGLFAIPAGPAGAQNGGSLLDAPRLGFEIDHNAGNSGDVVGAQVNPVDVQEHCITEVSDLVALFFDADHPDANSSQVYRTPGPVFADYMSFGPLIGIEPPADGQWPVTDQFPNLPIPPIPQDPTPAWVDPLYWAWNITFGAGTSLIPSEPWLKDTPERAASAVLWFFMTSFLGEPSEAGFAGEAKRAVLEAINIVTFVDPVTQELVGEMGGFDPDTGVGQVDVPDLAPGLWAVAAACVEPVVTEESFMAAISAGANLIVEKGVEMPALGAPVGYLPAEDIEEIAAAMVVELMAPRALGIEFYCILQDDGFCATPPDLVGLLEELTDEELAEFADLEAGAEGTGAGSDVDAELLTEAVTAAPSFTG